MNEAQWRGRIGRIRWKSRLDHLTQQFVDMAGPGVYADGGGLYLQCTAAKEGVSKSWIFRYATGRKRTSAAGRERSEERQMGLGPVYAVSLALARRLAADARALRAKGIDPIDARRIRKPTGIKMHRALADYLMANKSRWSPQHLKQSMQREKHISAIMGGVDIGVFYDDVAGLEYMKKILSQGGANGGARSDWQDVRGLMESAIGHAGRHDVNLARFNPWTSSNKPRPSKNESFSEIVSHGGARV